MLFVSRYREKDSSIAVAFAGQRTALSPRWVVGSLLRGSPWGRTLPSYFSLGREGWSSERARPAVWFRAGNAPGRRGAEIGLVAGMASGG